MTELDEKRRRAHAVLDEHDLDALVLRRPGNVAWYSGGGRSHVVQVQDVGVADVVVRRDGDEVVTAVNEAPRLQAEELGGLAAEWTVLPWNADREAALPRGNRVGTDSAYRDARVVAAAVEAARRSLTDPEVDRYRDLGRDAAAAMTDAVLSLEPARSEYAAAAALASELAERGIDAVVLLVAGETRLPHHRHPLPTSAPVGRLAMLVACARRHGLIASLTRFVSVGRLPAELADAQQRLLHVDVAFNRATVPGSRVGDVFAAGRDAYAENGFDAGEWRLHHQGGPTGYEPRDYVADENADALVERAQAFAWNPSVPSLKCEDTVVAGDAPEVVTVDARWPVAEVEGLARPLVLER
jgi:Xaa-Pro aminopeptidase